MIKESTLDQFSYEEEEVGVHNELIRPLLTANTIRPRTLADASPAVAILMTLAVRLYKAIGGDHERSEMTTQFFSFSCETVQ